MVNLNRLFRPAARAKMLALAVCLVAGLDVSAQIIYPGRAAPQMVRRSESFTILYREDSASPVESVTLNGPYNKVRLDIAGQTRGKFEYDSYTHAAANLKITVRVPAAAPEELYDLTVAKAQKTAVSKRAVKIVRDFKKKHTIILISDPHITRQWTGSPEKGAGVELGRFDNFVRVANLLNPDFVVCAGDLIHDYTRMNADPDGWGGQTKEKASERPYVEEKWNNYYEGVAGFQGVYGLRAPVFSVAGNHDHYGVPEQEYAAQWNHFNGLRVYGVRYGTTRLLVMDNYLAGAKTMPNGQLGPAGYPEDQRETLEAFLKNEGPGSLRILAQHDCSHFPLPFLNQHKVQLAFVGHTHKPTVNKVNGAPTEVTSPGSVSKSGEKDPTMGWFRIVWVDGDSYTLSPDLKFCSNSPGLPHDEQKLNLTAKFEKSNDGRAVSNTATLRNDFDIDLTNVRVRFVMKKGSYGVSGGVIDQVIDGGAVSLLDVNVNLGRRSVGEVRVSAR